MKLIALTYRALRRIRSEISLRIDRLRTLFMLRIQAVDFERDILIKGMPQIHVSPGGTLKLGKGFRINSGISYNRIGRQGPSMLTVASGATLRVGDFVGISSSAIICKHSITIGDRVKLGGNVAIYDTDFHSLDATLRADIDQDEVNRTDKPVVIEDDVFIGAHATILKGVTIGRGAIIGACALVSKDVPAGEIWAGNPAKCVRAAQQTHLIKAQ